VPDRDRNEHGRAENQRPRDLTGRPLPYDTTETELAEDHEDRYETVDDGLAIAVDLWDQERFFEAHECLEDVWHHAPEDDREFWKGVIQVAVGCVHHQRGNPHGVVTLLGRARDRLAGYPATHHGIDAARLVGFCDRTVAAVAAGGDTVAIEYPRFPATEGGPWFARGTVTPLERRPPWQVAAEERAAAPDPEDRA
jgi:predicted metal-dependent hydrolase